jgi:hypothetical protein
MWRDSIMNGESGLHVVLIGVWDDGPLKLLVEEHGIQIGVGTGNRRSLKIRSRSRSKGEKCSGGGRAGLLGESE